MPETPTTPPHGCPEPGLFPGSAGRLTRRLMHEVVIGDYQPGDALPCVDDLCAAYRTARGPMHIALRTLTDAGMFSQPRPCEPIRVRPSEHWALLDPRVVAVARESHLACDIADLVQALPTLSATLPGNRLIAALSRNLGHAPDARASAVGVTARELAPPVIDSDGVTLATDAWIGVRTEEVLNDLGRRLCDAIGDMTGLLNRIGAARDWAIEQFGGITHSSNTHSLNALDDTVHVLLTESEDHGPIAIVLREAGHQAATVHRYRVNPVEWSRFDDYTVVCTADPANHQWKHRYGRFHDDHGREATPEELWPLGLSTGAAGTWRVDCPECAAACHVHAEHFHPLVLVPTLSPAAPPERI